MLSKHHKFAENLDFAFSRCNFALVSLLKHAPFWRTTIPKAFRYHTEGTQNAWLRESTPPFALHSVFDRSPFILRWSSVDPPFILRWSSVRAPFKLRSSSVHPPFVLRSFSVSSSFVLRSFSVRSPFVLRWSSVQSPFALRSAIEDWSKNERRFIGGKMEMYRNSNGKPRERQPEQKNAQNPP